MESPTTWDGKDLPYWLGVLRAGDDEARWNAIDVIRHIAEPSQSVSIFVESLSDPYWRARALAAHALYDLSFDKEFVGLLSIAIEALASSLTDESPHVAQSAAYALGRLGSTAHSVLPQLRAAALSGPYDVRKAATDAISKIGESNRDNRWAFEQDN
jgi:HEAT repeat protein